jgi:formylglycine-generating enzyme required for sulfatase activity
MGIIHIINNNAKREYRKKTTPVESFAHNAWGLYDMHGNNINILSV